MERESTTRLRGHAYRTADLPSRRRRRAILRRGVQGTLDAFAAGRHDHDIATSLLARPDEVMLEVGAGGELLVARLRVVIAALLLLLPLVNAVDGRQHQRNA